MAVEKDIRRAGSANRRKTHCKHGHKFTPENTCIRRLGLAGGFLIGRAFLEVGL